MENEDLVSVSQVNDEFTLISLFLRAFDVLIPQVTTLNQRLDSIRLE